MHIDLRVLYNFVLPLPLSFVAAGVFNSFSFPGSVKEVFTLIK